MKKAIVLMMSVLTGATLGAQTFGYGWHNTQNDEISYYTNETKVVGDTVYALYTFNGDTLDANPYAAQNWIYDSSLTTWSQVVYLTKFTTAGQYVSSMKLMEIPDGGMDVNDFEIDNNGQLVIIGYANAPDMDFDPTTNVVGSYMFPSGAGQFCFVAFYTSSGVYTGHIEYPLESTSYMQFEDAVIDSANRMYLVGAFKGTVDFDFTAGIDSLTSRIAGSDYDGAVVCIDLNAQSYVWGRGFGSDLGDFISFAAVGAGQLMLYGTFSGNTIDMDPSAAVFNKSKPAGTYDWDFLARWTLGGSFVNCTVFGGLNDDVEPGGLVADQQGNVYVSGNCYYHDTVDVDPSGGVHLLDIPENYACFVIKYGATFGLQWATTFSSGDFVRQSWTYERNALLNGTSFLLLGAELGSGPLYSTQNGISTPQVGNGYYGSFFGAINKSTGAVDTAFAVRGDSAVHSSAYVDLDAITMDAEDNVYINGEFNASVDLNPFDAVTTYDTSYYYMNQYYYDRPYLLKLNAMGFTGIPDHSTSGILVFPNPTNGSIYVESENEIASVVVFDISGNVVRRTQSAGSQRVMIDLSESASGIYFVQTTSANGMISTSKVIRQ